MTVIFIRENEINEIWRCDECNRVFDIPRGCDTPDCDCVRFFCNTI